MTSEQEAKLRRMLAEANRRMDEAQKTLGEPYQSPYELPPVGLYTDEERRWALGKRRLIDRLKWWLRLNR